MEKEIRMTKLERFLGGNLFLLRISSLFRHSSFVIHHFTNANPAFYLRVSSFARSTLPRHWRFRWRPSGPSNRYFHVGPPLSVRKRNSCRRDVRSASNEGITAARRAASAH